MRPRSDLEYTRFYPEIRKVDFAANATLSDPVDLDGTTLVGMILPDNWNTAPVTFQVSIDGVNWFNLVNQSGTLVQTGQTGGRYYVFDQQPLTGIRFIRLRSGTDSLPVPQTGDRVVLLVCRAQD